MPELFSEVSDDLDKAQNTIGFANLESVITCMITEMNGFEHSDSLSLTDVHGYAIRIGIDQKAFMAIMTRYLQSCVASVPEEDQQQCMDVLLNTHLAKALVQTMEMMFLAGFNYHDRNVTLVDELLKEKNPEGE